MEKAQDSDSSAPKSNVSRIQQYFMKKGNKNSSYSGLKRPLLQYSDTNENEKDDISILADKATQTSSVIESEPSNPIVTIIVGNDAKVGTFFVDKCLICAKSDYFLKEFTSGMDMSESKAKKLVLNEENPKVFELFVQWVYTDRVHFDSDDDDDLVMFIRFYSFAIKIEEISLADDIIETILEYLRSKNKVLTISLGLYNGLTIDKGLGKLAVDCHALIHTDPNMSKNGINQSLECLKISADLSIAVLQKIADWAKSPREGTRREFYLSQSCSYHLHETGIACKAKDLVKCQKPIDKKNDEDSAEKSN